MRLVLVLLSTALSAFAAECTVEEQATGPLYLSLSARFSVGSMNATLTLPRELFQHDVVTAFIEVAGSNSPHSPKLFLETDGDRVAIENGAALHLTPRVHERIVFNLSAETGESLCTWHPAVRINATGHPPLPDGFGGIPASIYFNTGEPIHLAIGGRLASPSAPFRIDREDAPVLARTSWEVILRDPHPATGFRTIESPGNTIALPFVQIVLRLTKMNLSVMVVGFDAVRRNLDYSPDLLLSNMNDRTMSVLCGKSFGRSHDEYNGRVIPLRRDSDGTLTATCKVEYHVKHNQEGRALLIARILERPPVISKHRLRLPRQPFAEKSVLE